MCVCEREAACISMINKRAILILSRWFQRQNMLFSLCIRQDILLLLSGVSVALLRKAQNGVAYFLKLSESTAKAACFSSKTS